MNPDDCLAKLIDALAVQDWSEVSHTAEDLRAWIARGGFIPKFMMGIKVRAHPELFIDLLGKTKRYAQRKIEERDDLLRAQQEEEYRG